MANALWETKLAKQKGVLVKVSLVKVFFLPLLSFLHVLLIKSMFLQIEVISIDCDVRVCMQQTQWQNDSPSNRHILLFIMLWHQPIIMVIIYIIIVPWPAFQKSEGHFKKNVFQDKLLIAHWKCHQKSLSKCCIKKATLICSNNIFGIFSRPQIHRN